MLSGLNMGVASARATSSTAGQVKPWRNQGLRGARFFQQKKITKRFLKI